MSSNFIIESRKEKMWLELSRNFQDVFFNDLTSMIEGNGCCSLENIFYWVDLTKKEFFEKSDLESLYNKERDLWDYHEENINLDEKEITEVQFAKKTDLCNWISGVKKLENLLQSKNFFEFWSTKNKKLFKTSNILLKIGKHAWSAESSIFLDNPSLQSIGESEFEKALSNQDDEFAPPAYDATAISKKLKNSYAEETKSILLEDLELIMEESRGKAKIIKGDPFEFFSEDLKKVEGFCSINIDDFLIAAFIY